MEILGARGKMRYRVWLPSGDTLPGRKGDNTPRMIVPNVEEEDPDNDICVRSDGTVVAMLYQFDELRPIPDAVVMLSSGLNDKDGKEIFEGDVVDYFDSTEMWLKGHIRLLDGGLAVVATDDDQENPDNYISLHDFYSECGRSHEIAVRGNVFQNPELLKETT